MDEAVAAQGWDARASSALVFVAAGAVGVYGRTLSWLGQHLGT